jgi:hypothetical protein
VNVALGLALSEIVCEDGEGPPAVAVYDRDGGLTAKVGAAALTINVIGIPADCPLPVTVTVPV